MIIPRKTKNIKYSRAAVCLQKRWDPIICNRFSPLPTLSSVLADTVTPYNLIRYINFFEVFVYTLSHPRSRLVVLYICQYIATNRTNFLFCKKRQITLRTWLWDCTILLSTDYSKCLDNQRHWSRQNAGSCLELFIISPHKSSTFKS